MCDVVTGFSYEWRAVTATESEKEEEEAKEEKEGNRNPLTSVHPPIHQR